MDLRLVKESEFANLTIYAWRSSGLQNLVASAVTTMTCKALVGNIVKKLMKVPQLVKNCIR